MCFSFFLQTACRKAEKKTITISGVLTDSTNHNTFQGITMHFKSIEGMQEVYLGEAIIKNYGEFKFVYETPIFSSGPYLSVSFDTAFHARDKFRFLPLGENWHKNFYVGDSSGLYIKSNFDLEVDDTLYVYTGNETIQVIGPKSRSNIGEFKVTNFRNDYYYKIGYNGEFHSILHIPTGDPIVDTITLEINP